MKKVDLQMLRVYLVEFIMNLDNSTTYEYSEELLTVLKLVERKVKNYDTED